MPWALFATKNDATSLSRAHDLASKTTEFPGLVTVKSPGHSSAIADHTTQALAFATT